MPIQSCGQSVSAPRGKAGARLNANTELRAKRQRSVRETIYRNRPIVRSCLQSLELVNRRGLADDALEQGAGGVDASEAPLDVRLLQHDRRRAVPPPLASLRLGSATDCPLGFRV
jgi:hypothetical protein